MKILGAYRSDAAGYYRISAPFSVLRYRTEHEFDVGRPTTESAREYDVLWLQQHADPVAELVAREFQDAGKLVVYDMDDWLFGLPASWPTYSDFFRRGQALPTDRLMHHERLLRLADVVTCSTPLLARKLEQYTGRDDARVLPNCIVQGDWDTVIPAEHAADGPVLGWFGTGNHWDDWTEIVGAVDVALEVVGGHLALLGAPELVAMFPQRLARRTMVQPLVPMRHFPQVRRLIAAFDVGLAWCTDRFTANRCRSTLKAIQYGAAGVPVVASRTVYGEIGNEFISTVGDAGELVGGLVEALADADPMTQTPTNTRATRWQAEVWHAHSYETRALHWLEIVTGGRGNKGTRRQGDKETGGQGDSGPARD